MSEKNYTVYTAEGYEPDQSAVEQLERCLRHPSAISGALMADHHKGYSMPIGGVIAYADQVSPSGVGFDIGCGNCAMETNLHVEDIKDDLPGIMDAVERNLAFGLGRSNVVSDHRLDEAIEDFLENPLWDDMPDWVYKLRSRAADQFGTVGSGNHYVNIMADGDDKVWVCNHFGSRGLGHTIATGFLNLAKGNDPKDRYQDDMDGDPVLLDMNTDLGQTYDAARALAATYALWARLWVAQHVTHVILRSGIDRIINVHHNDYWLEEVDGELAYVVRKGATPLPKGEMAYIGGSMTDGAAIVAAIEDGPDSLESAPHGSGRIMSRSQAKGNRKGTKPGKVTPEMMFNAVREAEVELRGGDLDESPFVYRKLDPVLAAHPNIRVIHRLRPLGVCMAPSNVVDPYKD